MAPPIHGFAVFICVLLSILVHYEVLSTMNLWLPRTRAPARTRILLGVLGALFAHLVEVMLFAAAYFLADNVHHGELAGALTGTLEDYVYFSFVTYTTVGYGEIVPQGHIRWLAGVESLVGLLLVTWSASFLYLEMVQNWHRRATEIAKAVEAERAKEEENKD